jgi:hypothetical protein
MTLELIDKELEVVRELIDRRLTELKVEIHRTDSPFYRDELEKENEILVAVQRRLPMSSVRF